MLSKYIKIDSVQYPNPVKYSARYTNNEVVNLSEAYTELVSVNRLAKFGFNATFQLTSYWRDKVFADCKKPSVKVLVDGVEYDGRLRVSSMDLEQYSETTEGTQGLWTVKVTFTEF